MTELIEMNDITVDVLVRELRVGDEVMLTTDGDIKGVVVSITRPLGAMQETASGVTTEMPPVVVVRLQNGYEVETQCEFLRSVVWRWHAMGLRRS